MLWFAIPLAVGVGAALLSDDDDVYAHDDYDSESTKRGLNLSRLARGLQDSAGFVKSQRQYFLEKYNVEIQLQGSEVEFIENGTELDKQIDTLKDEIEAIGDLIQIIDEELR